MTTETKLYSDYYSAAIDAQKLAGVDLSALDYHPLGDSWIDSDGWRWCVEPVDTSCGVHYVIATYDDTHHLLGYWEQIKVLN